MEDRRYTALLRRIEDLETAIARIQTDYPNRIKVDGWNAIISFLSPTGCRVPMSYPVVWWENNEPCWFDGSTGELCKRSSPGEGRNYEGVYSDQDTSQKMRKLKEIYSKEHLERMEETSP